MSVAAEAQVPESGKTIAGYYTLAGLYTLSAAAIWGVNTLFLLDAGLSFFEVFVANGAFSLGTVLFEIPTGVVADTLGRRISFLLSVSVLAVSTLAYVGLAEIGRRGGRVRRGLRSDGPRVHLLFGCDGSVARRCPRGDGLSRRPRPGVRARLAGDGLGDARRNRRWRIPGTDRPQHSLRRQVSSARSGVRRRLRRDARRRLHAALRSRRPAVCGDREKRTRRHGVRLGAAASPTAHAGVTRPDGLPELGVLRIPALSARPARERSGSSESSRPGSPCRPSSGTRS